MTWSELSNFLNSQRLALVPRPISEFAQIGEKAADTFKRLEITTRESLDEAVRGFAKTNTWPTLTDNQTLMLYFRLGVELWGHELRSGGFFSRQELYDGIQQGLQSDYINEAHGRIVLDFLDQLWKVQWIGVGVSYMWGSSFNGWSYGADVTFRF